MTQMERLFLPQNGDKVRATTDKDTQDIFILP